MSHEAVQAVLERTLSDDTFRAQLFARPDEALAGYELTDEEAAALRSLTIEAGSVDARALDDRQSKKTLWELL